MLIVREFLRDLDLLWPPAPRIPLRIIGSTALFLQTDYERGTKDSDVLETRDIDAGAKERLLALGGQGTRLHDRHRIYLDVVDNALPLLPHVPLYHPVPALAGLAHFEVLVLDVVDVCVSKVKRFSAHDRDDILAMVERGLVDPASLARRFADAIEDYTGPAEEEDFRRYNANLHRVQRDMLGVETSEMVLPAWMADRS